MSALNKVQLIGHLGKDPEIRTMASGGRVATLNLATSETWKDKSTGEKKERTEWHRVTLFNDSLAQVCEKYLKKGSRIYVEGKLQTRKWTDDKGVDRYTTEVVLAEYGGNLILLGDSRAGSGSPPPPDSADDYGNTRTREPAPGHGTAQTFNLDDEIPF